VSVGIAAGAGQERDAPTSEGRGGWLGTTTRRHPLAAFFGLAHALSWLGWLPLVAHATGFLDAQPSPYWHLLGGLGPLLAACLVSGAMGGGAGLRDLLARATRWRVGVGWWAVALLAPALLYVVAALGIRLVAGRWPDLGQFGRSVEYPALPLLVYWLANLVCYGFGEEVGWRGFALPRLQRGRGALRATVLFSLPWAAWHLPLFTFAGGLAQLGPTGTVGWYLSLLTGAVLLTWLCNSTGGSVLLVAVFHGAIDIAITSPADPQLANAMGALITLWGLAVVVVAGPRHLAHGRRKEELPSVVAPGGAHVRANSGGDPRS